MTVIYRVHAPQGFVRIIFSPSIIHSSSGGVEAGTAGTVRQECIRTGVESLPRSDSTDQYNLWEERAALPDVQ